MELEAEERDFTPVSDEPEADFRELAAAALHNAGINTEEQLWAAQEAARDAPADIHQPAVVEPDEDEIVYEITFGLPNEGLPGEGQSQIEVPLGNDQDDTTIAAILPLDADAPEVPLQCYPSQFCRSAVGNQPYDQFAPRVAFLQLGTTRAHGSITEASRRVRVPRGERILGTTSSSLVEPLIDDTIHGADDAMITTSEDELKVWRYVMTQYKNIKPDLRKFGNKGEMAAMNELTQLHVMDTWKPMYADKLSQEQRMQVLSSLLFLKEKRSRDIKGRACVNSVPQRAHIPKDEAAFPTVSTESTFITALIAAKERRKVQCYDVPSMILNTIVDEEVFMVLKGELAEMMIQIAPEVYRKYVSVDKKGTKILYVKLQKALYGLMQASLLFYWKLRKELEGYGFEINPHDPCIANRMTEVGKQLTVIWHIDNLMGSCEDDFELTKFLFYLSKIYGPKLCMHMGCKHDYLSVNMVFNKDGTLDVSMFKYLQDVIDDFAEVIRGRAASPAAAHLFKVRDEKEAPALKEEIRH